MAIKIFWGPPGSYKTSSAVAEEVARAAKEGRTVVTNVRGLTESKVREHYPGDIADGFEVIPLKQNDPADLERIRRWWHWVPFGSVIIFDEIQSIYPPDWTAKQLHDLDMTEERRFPASAENPEGELIPAFVGLIFDMHRHGNWDCVFTTPSIKKVRGEIRAAAEIAYKHKNLAIIGMPGSFMQSMHQAEDNGNPSDIYSTRRKRIPKWVWLCYGSTATGAIRDTSAGTPIWQNPKLLFLLAMVAASILSLFYFGLPTLDHGSTVASTAPRPEVHASDHVSPDDLHRPDQGLLNGRQYALSQQPSERWRVIAVVTTTTTQRIYLASGKRVMPMSPESCDQGDYGWWCQVDDGVATQWTGPEPIVDVPPPTAVQQLNLPVDMSGS